uniref:Exocyst subunit Exo70 family protein n=1 Tax=Oryza brachyantha TaxID=4533 RepID=J3L6W4_ORYBR
MGAAAGAGKAVGDIAAASSKTQAERRLAVAEQAILGWRRACSPGVWDSDATCTNESLLSAVDEIILLAEIHAFPMASAARRSMEGALGVAVSCLVGEFLRLRVWDASQMEIRLGLRFAAGKFPVPAATSGVSLSLAFPTTGSISTASTIDELYASGGSQSSAADAVTVLLDGDFFDELDLMPASLSVLHQIALRIIRGGFTKELLHAFTNAPCDVLDRFMSILQLECPFEIDHVSFEDAEWWTAEDMIKRWILTIKLVAKVLAVMQSQLNAQSCGAFDRFKNDYFMAMAKNSIFVLLRFANGFTSTEAPDKLVYVLEMYEALSNAAPGLLLLFTEQRVELISRQVEVVLAKLARALRIMVGGLITRIRTADRSQTTGSAACGVGVHPLTRYAMTCVELLAPHGPALDVILSNGGAAEGVNSLGGLVAVLVTSLERNLEEISPEISSDDGDAVAASRHLFLATNASFVARRAVDAGVESLLGEGWAARRGSLISRYVASYVEACWAPVVACLETSGWKPAKAAVAKFIAAFDKAYESQMRREVPDPALRDALRKAASEVVVPAYSVYLQKHPELVKNVRYTAGELGQLLSELFEGEAAES